MSAVTELTWPDIEPSYEWYREAEIAAAEESPVLASAPAPEPAEAKTGCPAVGSNNGRTYVCWLMPLHPGPHYDAIDHTHWRDGRKITHWQCASEPAPPTEKPRCPACGYLTIRCTCPGGPRS